MTGDIGLTPRAKKVIELGYADPRRIGEMVRQARAVPGYTPKPILFNEDDHYDFDRPTNNFAAATSAERASVGPWIRGSSWMISHA